jgi:hypothetical protein
MDWADLVGHVRARHPVIEADGVSLELSWDFTDGELAVRQHQAIGRAGACYVVSSELGVPRRAWAALRVGAVRFGTLVEDDDRLELRAYLAASRLARETLDHVLHAVAYEAARLAMDVARHERTAPAVDGAA